MIRLLISDDSAFMRIAIRKMVEPFDDIQVVGEARTGQMAVEMAENLKPDVITMDVEMPVMDGLEATKQIMARAPTPIIMLSSLTERNSVTTIKALELGAVDFIAKKSSFVQLDIVKIGEDLVEKLRYWGKKKTRVSMGARSTFSTSASGFATEPLAPVSLKGRKRASAIPGGLGNLHGWSSNAAHCAQGHGPTAVPNGGCTAYASYVYERVRASPQNGDRP
ncbi:MAG: Chemotaxis response regulator protein-glutamate methylesterase [Pseudomonadota bacterium]